MENTWEIGEKEPEIRVHVGAEVQTLHESGPNVRHPRTGTNQ